jgi:hypothetical protein
LEPEAGENLNPEADQEAEIELDPEAENEPDPEAEIELDPEADPETEIELDPEAQRDPAPEGDQEAEKKQNPAEAPPSGEDPKPATPLDLLNYLKTLTKFLPPEKAEEFQSSGMEDKMEEIRNRLRKKLAPETPVPENAPAPAAGNERAERIQKTLSIIGKLADYSPDPELQKRIKNKIGNILTRMKTVK